MIINGIEVKKADNKKVMNDFVSLPRKIYKDCKLYVPDLDISVREFFDPKKNKTLGVDATVQPFVAYKNGEPVGRIAGIIGIRSNKTWGCRNVRFSHIEFIDDLNVSAALLQAVEEWGRARGMVTIQGPMGVTDFDKEGMLIEDFELGGTFLEIWNHSYYPKHMEALGYLKEADWLHVRVKVPETVPARYARVAAYTKEQFGLRVVKKTKKEVYEKYGQMLFKLVNVAYAPLFGFAPFTEEQIDDLLKMYVPLLNMDIVPFIMNEKDELVGIAVTLRDFSEGMAKTKGKLFPFGWAHLLKSLKANKGDRASLMIIAVRPDMQGLGVNALVFDDLIPIYNKMGIKWCETGPQLETNVKELSQWKPLNPELVKRRRCWQKKI